MSKSWFKIVNKAESRDEVYILDDIGIWGITAQDFIDEIKGIEGDWNLHMATDGGSITEGIAIHNAIRNHPGNVAVYIDGVVASMGTYIMLAGDTREIAENAWLMIHNASGVAMGDSEQLRKVAEIMDGLQDTILNGYVSVTGLDREELVEMMNEETWFNAQQAKENRFVDTVGPPLQMVACRNPERYINAPEFQNAGRSTERKATQQKPKKQDTNMSDLKDKLIAANVVKHTASDSDAVAQLDAFMNKAKETEAALGDVVAKLEDTEARNIELQSEIASTKEASFEAKVDAAIEAKKITDKQKEGLMKAFSADSDSASSLLDSFEAPKAPTAGTTPMNASNNNTDLDANNGALPEKNKDGSINYTNKLANAKAAAAAN